MGFPEIFLSHLLLPSSALALLMAASVMSEPLSICAISCTRSSSVSMVIVETVPFSVSSLYTL